MHQPKDITTEPELARELMGPTQAVMAVDFSQDTQQLVFGGEDKWVILWNLTSKHNKGIKLYEHKGSITSVAFGRNYFVSSSMDGQVKLWKSDQLTTNTAGINGQCYDYGISNSPVVRSVSCSSIYPKFCTGCDDKTIKVYSAEYRNKPTTFKDGHKNWIKCVRWSKRDPDLIASCGDDGNLCIWDTRLPTYMQPIIHIPASRRSMGFNCLDWHPKYKDNIATGAKDGTCFVWDLRSKKPIQLYAQHNMAINSVAFNECGNFLISGSSDHTIKGFDILEGRHVFDLFEDRGPVNSVAFDSTGDLFASASKGGVSVWKSNIEACDIITDEEVQSQLLVDTTIGYNDSEPSNGSGDLDNVDESCEKQKKTTEINTEMFDQILTMFNTLCTELSTFENTVCTRFSTLEKRISTLEQKVR